MKYLKIRWIAVLLSVVGTSFFFGFKSGDSRSFQVAKNLDIFNSIVKELDMFYVDTIDPNKTIRTGIESMLYSLDPYTQYFPEDDQSELEQMLKNTYGGIGSIITWNTKLKRSMIAEPYENMPAATVGLKAGDILLEIDGKDLAGKNNQEVSEMLRGQVGTSFKLKVQRPGTEQPLEFDIVRRSIQLPFIPYYAMLDNNIGYINLSTFSGNPSKEFKQAFLDLKKQGITSLVIDLRNNGGGLLDEAVEIANFFLPRGKTLVTTKGKTKQASNTYKTLREPLDLEIPLAVLVNSATASASEILAGALQDYDRAVVVGNRTFGKGLVQKPIPMPDGSMIRLTVARYYTPTGRSIQKPYVNGNQEQYNHDLIDRYNRGELMSADSIHFPDSMKYNTLETKRIVYGGGGIMPDFFVPIDTTQYTDYHRNLVAKGVVIKTTMKFIEKNRKELQNKYKKFETFNDKFEISDEVLANMRSLADQEKIKFNEKQYQKSLPLIKTQLKALIARDLWDMNEYFQIMNTTNNSVLQALKVLNKGAYEKVVR